MVLVGCFLLLSAITFCNALVSQTAAAPPLRSNSSANQISDILGLTNSVEKLRSLQKDSNCTSVASPEELSLRQHLLEVVTAAELDVSGAMGEIDNERGDLSNLQTTLKTRRDKTVSKLNAAALITGSGVGAAVSATQFTTVGSKTNNIGEGVGIGSGAVSTLLAYLAIRKQNGPSGSVINTPNMLAPLFDRPVVLHTEYPPIVLTYLNSTPPGEPKDRGTRLEQLRVEWDKSGRLNSSRSPQIQAKIAVLTTSNDKNVKISIDDLTDRMAMLGDVSGRIALMKRDLANFMRAYATSTCQPR